MEKPVPDDFIVFAEPQKEVSEETREKVFRWFDATIDKFLEGEEEE